MLFHSVSLHPPSNVHVYLPLFLQEASSLPNLAAKGLVKAAVGVGRLHRFVLLSEPECNGTADGCSPDVAALSGFVTGAVASGLNCASVGAAPSGPLSALGMTSAALLPAEPPVPSMDFAAFCLRNSLSLLAPVSSFVSASEGSGVSDPVSCPVPATGLLHTSTIRPGMVSLGGGSDDMAKPASASGAAADENPSGEGSKVSTPQPKSKVS